MVNEEAEHRLQSERQENELLQDAIREDKKRMSRKKAETQAELDKGFTKQLNEKSKAKGIKLMYTKIK